MGSGDSTLRAHLRRHALVAWCVALVSVHVGLLVHESRLFAPTADEPAHVASGVAHWDRGTFELYRPNPPLARMLGTLPVIARTPRVDYRGVDSEQRSEWRVGQDFMAANGAARFVEDLRAARLVSIAWSVLGAILIARWAFELWGRRASALAITLWCLEPTILGHAPLVTPDVASAVAGFGATYAFWHYVQRPSWSTCGLSGVLLGIAQLTKFTQLALYGVWPVMWWLGRRRRRPHDADDRRAMPTSRVVAHGAAIVAISVLVINAGYGFHGALPRLGDVPFRSDLLSDEAPDAGNRLADSWLGRLVLPVPEDYVRGLDAQQADFDAGLPSYLRGELRDRGWWYYYAYAAAVKLPLGLWLLGGWALVLMLRRRAREDLVLLLPAAAFVVLASAKTGFSHHFRYVLPAFPFALLAVSRLGTLADARTPRRAAIVLGATAAMITSSLAVYPHSLSYFNELAGGPAHGDEHLIDSNLDWGQDLFALRRWVLERRPRDRIGLAYFGSMDPRSIGIEYAAPPRRHARPRIVDRGRAIEAPTLPASDTGPQPGLYAVSVNFVRGIRFALPVGSGQWRHAAFEDFTYFQELAPFETLGTTIRLYCVDRATSDSIRARHGWPPSTRPEPACAGWGK